MNNPKLLIAKIILFWLSSFTKVFSQANEPQPDWIRLGFNLSPQINFSRFSESTIMHPSLRLTPMPVYAIGISWSIDLQKRLAIEGNINYSSMGARTRFNTAYPGNNIFEGRSISKTSHSVLSLPICLKYNSLLNSRHSKKYIKTGVNLLINPLNGQGYINSSSGTYDLQSNSYVKEDISWKENPFIAPNLIIGIGTEKHFKKGQMISFGLIFTKGFKVLEPWDFTLTYQGIKYENKIANKGKYLGFELKYFLTPLGFKSYKKALEKFNGNKKEE